MSDHFFDPLNALRDALQSAAVEIIGKVVLITLAVDIFAFCPMFRFL
jgi:hypothetical protein